MRFIWACTKRLLDQRNAISFFAKSRPPFSTSLLSTSVIAAVRRDDSAWREILDYFSSATQIGLTATPKETEYVSNINYFGEPVYSYSLKQGIRDGFLAPYKVIKVHIDRDVAGTVLRWDNLTVKEK